MLHREGKHIPLSQLTKMFLSRKNVLEGSAILTCSLCNTAWKLQEGTTHVGGKKQKDTENEAFHFTSHSVLSTDSAHSKDKNEFLFVPLKVNSNSTFPLKCQSQHLGTLTLPNLESYTAQPSPVCLTALHG